MCEDTASVRSSPTICSNIDRYESGIGSCRKPDDEQKAKLYTYHMLPEQTEDTREACMSSLYYPYSLLVTLTLSSAFMWVIV